MRIKELHIRNFRGFEDITINFPESNVCVFIGANGKGKTSLLDSIAILLSEFICGVTDKKDKIFSLQKTDIKVKKEFAHLSGTLNVESLKIKEINNLDLISEINHNSFEPFNQNSSSFFYEFKNKNEYSKTAPILSYYPSNRFLLRESNHKKKVSSSSDFLKKIYLNDYSFSSRIRDFNDFAKWFRQEEDLENQNKVNVRDFYYENDTLKFIRYSTKTFLQSLESKDSFGFLRVDRKRDGLSDEFKVDISFELVIEKNGNNFSLAQLSEGEKMVLLLVCDISRRLSLANKWTDPSEGLGIVLIDEIELHLHPQWQRNVIPALRKTFPKIQFIITTHSPQVLSNVANGEVILLENGKVFQNFAHNFGQDSNTILNDFFNTSERPQEIKTELDKLFQLIELEKLQEAKTLLGKLIEKLGESDFDLIKAKTELEYFADEIH